MNKPVAWMFKYNKIVDNNKPEKGDEHNWIPLYSHPAKELTDEEWNKVFDFYCETDEGVLKFDLELRDEWKREQLIRWKEALRKAQRND